MVAVTASWFALQQVDQEVSNRLKNVLTTVERATYPLTSNILEQLTKLSGANFVVYDTTGTVTGTTLHDQENNQEITAIPQLGEIPSQVSDLTIGEEEYFSGKVILQQNRGTAVVLYPKDLLIAARWQAVFPPAMVGICLLILSPLTSFWISRRIGRRIQRVQRHVSRIAGGDLTPMPPVKSHDELRELSGSINSMVMMLDQSMKRLRDNERAAMLTQLVGGLAHQLRNALTGARVSVQLHRRHCPSSHDEALEIALKQLTFTEEQIKALLRLSRGESEITQPGDLGEILDEVVALVRPICQHKKISLLYERDQFRSTINDQDALRGAILNLLMNAIEATDSRGEIRVIVKTGHERVDVDIIDGGPGVADEISENVFSPFFTTKPEGAGLGLALARQAAEDCDGSLTIATTSPSTFRLSIPRPDSA